MLGRTIAHYRIVSQLGAGGMGVVYAAEDIRLGRPVALKFVPEDLAADHQAVERFRVEARAASGLNHPHICTIYDIGEDSGRPFIVMELLKGQTLRDRLSAGPMKIHHIVDAGIQIADALDAAHSHGIVHRDIKPANLFFLDRGQVKILDFGLAKLAPGHDDGGTTTGAARTADQLTAPGVTLGTVSYMSPEQAAGDDLDGRTDLFSLGVVLYECATGHRPFTGNSAAVILAAILNKSPVAPVVFNPELPLRLQDVINNCLEKDRDLRYQTAADLRADLRRVKRDLESGRLTAADATSERMSGVGVGSGTGAGSGVARRGTGATPSVGESAAASVGAAPGGRPLDATRDGPHPSGQVVAPLSSGPEAAARRVTRRGPIAAAAAAIVLIAIAVATYFLSSRGQATMPQAVAQRVDPSREETRIDIGRQALDSGNYRAALLAAEQALAATPDHVDARKVREEARAKLAQFDVAMADARRLLRTGNPRDASRALERARAIDATGPGVVELSAEVAEAFRQEAERARQELQRSREQSALPPATRSEARSSPGASGRESPRTGTAAAPTSSPSPAVSPSSAGPVAPPSSPTPSGTPPSAVPPVPPPSKPTEDPVPAKPREEAPPAPPQPTPAPATGTPRTPATEAARSAAPPTSAAREDRREPETSSPAASAADDESAIKRVLATYARAIETKDLALFRSVKPNLSATEEQRIEAGFRAVASQRVAISIDSIERQGAQALVRLRRRDTIDAGGRRQSAESQQTLRLARTDTGNWVIVEIGR